MLDIDYIYHKLFNRFKVDAFYAIYKTELAAASGDTTVGLGNAILATMDCPEDIARFWRWYWEGCLPERKRLAAGAIAYARQVRTPTALARARKRYRVYRQVRSIAVKCPTRLLALST